MPFEKLELSERILKALKEKGYLKPTPIQAQAIPHILAGDDIFGCAQTGTGKTAAFALPIIHKLNAEFAAAWQKGEKPAKKHRGSRKIRALILTPTRELAAQIAENFEQYGKFTNLKYAVVFGGVKQEPQARKLNKGVDILVATPGRLFDLMDQKIVNLDDVEMFVLDEADRMLDMGFLPDIRKVVKALPESRQTLFFSATLPKEIKKLADSILTDPVTIQTSDKRSSAADTVTQYLYYIEGNRKNALLTKLLEDPEITRAIVFTRTKRRADRTAKKLYKDSGIRAEAFHSDKTQNARQKILKGFKNGRTRVLIATDIASRGIDVDEITHVFNYDLPDEPESYVHRIGRTGRAGASGIAISFCNSDQRSNLKQIQKMLGFKIAVLEHDIPPMSTSERHQIERSKDSQIGKKQKQNRRRSTEDAWDEYKSPSDKPARKKRPGKAERAKIRAEKEALALALGKEVADLPDNLTLFESESETASQEKSHKEKQSVETGKRKQKIARAKDSKEKNSSERSGKSRRPFAGKGGKSKSASRGKSTSGDKAGRKPARKNSAGGAGKPSNKNNSRKKFTGKPGAKKSGGKPGAKSAGRKPGFKKSARKAPRK